MHVEGTYVNLRSIQSSVAPNIDIIDYVTGIGNGVQLPHKPHTNSVFYLCCACCAMAKAKLKETAVLCRLRVWNSEDFCLVLAADRVVKRRVL